MLSHERLIIQPSSLGQTILLMNNRLSTNKNDDSRTNAGMREEAIHRILHAALEVLSEKGSAGLTMADIGKRSGFSHALPIYYFKSKNKLLATLAYEVIRNFKRMLSSALEGRIGKQAILGIVSEYLKYAATMHIDAKALLILQSEATTSRPELLSYFQTANQDGISYLAEHLRLAMAQGEIAADFDPLALAMLILGTLRGLAGESLTDSDRIDLGEAESALRLLLERGLSKQFEEKL